MRSKYRNKIGAGYVEKYLRDTIVVIKILFWIKPLFIVKSELMRQNKS